MDAASETTVGGKEMSIEETAVLLSIRPEWCQKIFRGEKTMEIRKNFPKDFQGQPFKCFIYCTKGQKRRISDGTRRKPAAAGRNRYRGIYL